MYKPDELPARRRTWVKIASIPPAKLGWSLEDCVDVPADNMKILTKWTSAIYDDKIIRAEGKQTCGIGLMLYGLPGRGKTTVANTLIQESEEAANYIGDKIQLSEVERMRVMEYILDNTEGLDEIRPFRAPYTYLKEILQRS